MSTGRTIRVLENMVIGRATVSRGGEITIRDEELLKSEEFNRLLREGKIIFIDDTPPPEHADKEPKT